MAIEQLQTKSPRRVEDPRLLTGRGQFVDDLNFEGEVFMGLLPSPFAHAKIVRIDLSKVRSSPEFIDCLTGEDLQKVGIAPVTQSPWPPQRKAKRYQLAIEKVRYVGEPVVAILAKSKSSVEDLLEQVEVEYDPLPVVTTIEESKQKKALVYDDWDDNLSQQDGENYGDASGAIAKSEYFVNVREGIKRQEAAPIEPHATLVSYDKEKDAFDIYSTVQSAHGHQRVLSNELKVPPQKLHVRVMDVGGGFGSKGGPSYPWPVLACLFAKRNGLPVKFVATRTEEFYDAAAGRDEYCDVTLACDKDGRLTALKAVIECDIGVSGTQVHMPSLTMWTMSGAYGIPNVDIKVRSYVTNKMPIGPVRGAGAPEGCYFIERAMDVLAKKIGMDPVVFRKVNGSSKPSKSRDGDDEEESELLLDSLARHAEYSELVNWRNKLNAEYRSGAGKILGGIGISVRGSEESDDYDEEEGEESNGGSSWQNSSSSGAQSGASWPGNSSSSSSNWQANNSGGQGSSSSWGGGGQGASGSSALSFTTEYARIALQKSGEVLVYTGSSPHGQGEETTFAQLAAEELGVPIEKVRVIWGDTSLIPFGVGTFGSRSAAIGGSAVVEASRKLKTILLEKAAELLKVNRESIGFAAGLSVCFGATQLAPRELLEKLGVSEISAESRFTAEGMSYSTGAHLCAVILDPESGRVSVSKYVVVEDCGRMINRKVVEGQIHGGVVHGIGGALLEELVYDEDGNLLSINFGDYNIPSSVDSPNIDIFHRMTPSTVTLDGAKGVGESGTIASYAAVMNAVNDALEQARDGARVDVAPALPEDVYKSAR